MGTLRSTLSISPLPECSELRHFEVYTLANEPPLREHHRFRFLNLHRANDLANMNLCYGGDNARREALTPALVAVPRLHHTNDKSIILYWDSCDAARPILSYPILYYPILSKAHTLRVEVWNSSDCYCYVQQTYQYHR